MSKIIDLTAVIRQRLTKNFDKVWVGLSIEQQIKMLGLIVDITEKKVAANDH